MGSSDLVLPALILTCGVLLAHRTLHSLTNRLSFYGLFASGAGFGFAFLSWLYINFRILSFASSDRCRELLGIQTEVQVDVRQAFFPPAVSCSSNGSTEVLTRASTTTAWSAAWVIGWVLIAVGGALLLSGLVVHRAWRVDPKGIPGSEQKLTNDEHSP